MSSACFAAADCLSIPGGNGFDFTTSFVSASALACAGSAWSVSVVQPVKVVAAASVARMNAEGRMYGVWLYSQADRGRATARVRILRHSAIDMDPLSLLSRLAAAVPYPRLPPVRYSGVLASASTVRPRNARKQKPITAEGEDMCVQHTLAFSMSDDVPKRGRSRPWAEHLEPTFHFDVLECPKCEGRMRLLAMLTDGKELTRSLMHLGEPTDQPTQAPARGPPF
jgi:hypothetical protein